MRNIRKPYETVDRVTVDCSEGDQTHQSFKAECDINNVMARFEKTGLLDHVREYEGDYGDFIDAPDFHRALNEVRRAEEMFMTLPATVRGAFHNDAGQFLEFAQDPANAEELVRLGLAKPASVSAPTEAPPVASPTIPSPEAEDATPRG